MTLSGSLLATVALIMSKEEWNFGNGAGCWVLGTGCKSYGLPFAADDVWLIMPFGFTFQPLNGSIPCALSPELCALSRTETSPPSHLLPVSVR